MKPNFTYLMLLIFCLLQFSVKAQEQPDLRQRANQLYHEYKYASAAKLYLKLSDTGKPRLADLERLADCYHKMNNYEDAENWYARVTAFADSKPEHLISYGEVLKANSKYDQAKKVLQQYATKTGDARRTANDIAGCDSAIVWMAKPTTHIIRNETAVNTAKAEFSAFPLGNTIYYTAETENQSASRTYGWTGNSFLKVYTAQKSADDLLSSPLLMRNDINKESYHVGPVVSNKAADVLYITRTYPGKDAEISKEKLRKYRTNNLELLIQKKVKGQWQKAEPFIHNDVKNYSVGHACLSADEKILYFTSDRPGGLGGTDIWYSELQSDGKWGTPINAGTNINTSGNEMFPTLDAGGTLYYSTDGLPGMGGLDIFSSKGRTNQWSKPLNLRYPINSAGDDFAFATDKDDTQGYLSSNRKGGKGSDDIYAFSYRKPKLIIAVSDTIYNKQNDQIISAASVVLYGAGRTIVAKQDSRTDGVFLFELEQDNEYSLLATKTGFYADSVQLNTKNIHKSDTLHISLFLNPLFEKGKILALENIHYDFDKANIRPDAAKILDELVRTMRDNPTLKIELGSHTDSRGVDAYNMDLSQRRAQSVVNYLVSRGVARNRMVAKGYGETKLLNRCSNGVKCSAEEHQANRRTSFTILEY